MFIASLLPAAVGVQATHDHWTNLPLWWAASSATFALLGAAVAAQSTSQTLQIERNRDTAQAEVNRKAQAALVAAWCPRIRIEITKDLRVLPGKVPPLRAINRSGLPVTNIQYAFELKVFHNGTTTGYQGPVIERALIEPTDSPVDIALTSYEWEQVARLVMDAANVDILSDEGWTLTVGVAFTDTAGQHWIREPNGRLLEAPALLKNKRTSTAL